MVTLFDWMLLNMTKLKRKSLFNIEIYKSNMK